MIKKLESLMTGKSTPACDDILMDDCNLPAGIDRRSESDRRERATHPLSPASWQGRRQRGRRQVDRENTYVDRYDPVVRYICIGVLMLSCVDAVFTLRLIEQGGTELNPVMNFFLGIDISVFVYSKLFLTAFSLAVLVAHFNFRCAKLIKVSHLVYGLFAMYVLLINYEIFLLWKSYTI
jgi:hypothetical protein